MLAPMLDVKAVACLADNYAYLVRVPGAREAVVVDPSEALPVQEAAARAGVAIVGVLATHHHGDHTGGNEALSAARPGLRVFGHDSDKGRLAAQTDGVGDGDEVSIAGLRFVARHVPGHTLGAVAWCVADVVFSGDTLFLGGCGRLFEGTPAMLHASLGTFAALAPKTRVLCGHEYTLANLAFAAHVEPRNAAVRERIAAARGARARGEPTVGTIADELATNPFLRPSSHEARAHLGLVGARDVDVVAALRREKDGFRAPPG